MPTITREYKYATGSLQERLKFRTDRSGECWLWTGRLNAYGYAEIKISGRFRMAHRAAYEELVGAIPAGMQLDHLCRVRHCVNPAHLEPVTSRENTIRGTGLPAINAAKTHCKRGHAFDQHNTYTPPGGGRVCRTCHRTRQAAYRAARRNGVTK